jgi:hypothetical protein
MRWLGSSLLIIFLVGPGSAQESVPAPIATGIPVQSAGAGPGAPVVLESGGDENQGGFLKGDKGFRNFIGFMSNPTLTVDPRSLTQLFPIYSHTWMSAIRPLAAGGDVNVTGPGLNIALTERLNVGLSNGGYVWTDFRKTRAGWLDLGGYVQYTVIRDVPNQFLATAGLGWTAPSGSSAVFQGSPPASLAPYATIGKEFGEFHFLSTAGFKFPAGSGTATTQLFYGNVHLDRRCFGWFYPLVEFNWGVHTTNVDLNLPFRRDLFELDSFTASGNIVTVAPGFNAVIVQDKLEIGAVYETPIASQNNFHFNAVLVKVVFRY